MMTQAWNIYAFAVPIVNQFFGIKPLAHQKTIIIEPQMPKEWDNASLENVKVGDNEISVWHTTSKTGHQIKVQQTKTDWKIKLILPEANYNINEGNPETINENGKTIFTFSDNIILVTKS